MPETTRLMIQKLALRRSGRVHETDLTHSGNAVDWSVEPSGW